LAYRLMKEEFYIPDEKRNWATIGQILRYYMSPVYFNLFYEIKDFRGLVGFTEIYPEYKANLLWKMWDKSVFSKTFVRHSKELIDLIMNTYKLKRLETETADPNENGAKKMAEVAGFVEEGIKKNEYMWNGKLYDKYILAKYGG
jgi:RimJ/RimL family protein N-acetyltransferase